MQKGLSLSELAATIERQNTAKKDFIVDTKATEIVVVDDDIKIAFDGDAYPIREIAHDQIAARVDVPAKYARKMRAEAPDLYANNINTWFQKYPERRMVRTLDGYDRAFLSDRFQRIDNYEIGNTILQVLFDEQKKGNPIEVVSTNVTERNLYIQAVFPRLEGEVKRGDVVQAGVFGGNSEVGFGAAKVGAMARRLVCLNGMISDDVFRAYHVGKRIEDNEQLWSDEAKMADDHAILLKVRDMVRAATDEARFKARLDKMRGLTEGKVSGDPIKAVELLAQKVNATEEEKGGILRSLIEGGDLSAWGMLNAVTAQAHSVTSYDRSVELEAAGGALLDLPVAEWKRVLEAA